MKKRSTAKRTKDARARKTASTRKRSSATEVKVKASGSKDARASSGIRRTKPTAKPKPKPKPKPKTKPRSRATSPRGPGATAAKTLIVVTSGDRPVQEIAGELTGAGFVVDQVLEHIGQVTGRASAAALRRVKGIRGVTDVSPEHPPFDIGPPDAPVS